MVTAAYYDRVDISGLHATTINLNTKGKRYSVKTLIGPRPVLSDELEHRVSGEQILEAFKRIFPQTAANTEIRPKGAG